MGIQAATNYVGGRPLNEGLTDPVSIGMDILFAGLFDNPRPGTLGLGGMAAASCMCGWGPAPAWCPAQPLLGTRAVMRPAVSWAMAAIT